MILLQSQSPHEDRHPPHSPQDRCDGCGGEADQAFKQDYMRLIFFRMTPAKPTKPLPNNNNDAGSGTATS